MGLRLRTSGENVLVDLLVVPRSSREAVLGEHDGALRIAVTASPVEGEANAAVCTLLARALGVPRSSVSLVRGGRSKRKTASIEGVSERDVEALAAGWRR